MFGIFARTFMTATRTRHREPPERPHLRIPGAEDPFLRRVPFETRARR